MLKPIRRLIGAGTFLALTALLIAAAKYANAVVFAFYPKYSRIALGFLADLTAPLPFAVWEIGAALLLLWFFVSLFLAILRGKLVRWLTGLVLLLSIAAFAFVGLWGLNYFAPSMQERMNLPEKQFTAQELREATEYFRDKANATASGVERDENGVMCAGDFEELSLAAGDGYKVLAKRYSCFDGSTARVKPLLTSKLMGAAGTTGVFVAFTGESGVSSTTFAASVPETMCHEIAHRMAFAREDEANFAAFLACMENGRADFLYSGYYSAFIYCYNALYAVDANAAAEVMAGASTELAADLRAASRHYDEVEDKTAVEVHEAVYDTYLKSFSVESGVQSYGDAVDLLTTWYFERLK